MRWQGFERVDLDAVVDLGSATAIERIAVRFLQNGDEGIFLPTRVDFYSSDDGVGFRRVGDARSREVTAGEFVRELGVEDLNRTARFVRIHAANVGVCPPGHPKAGSGALLLADEILIAGR